MIEPAPNPVEETTVASPLVSSPTNVLAVTLGTLLIVGMWVLLQLAALEARPFHTKGEPREGLVVWEMTHGGGWILPRRNGTELPSKPPLFHWLGAVASRLHGATDEWSIRLPSAGLSLLGLLGVFAAGTALWSAGAGIFSALSLMTMFEWARSATNARVDMTLTFGLELAFLSLLFFLRRRTTGWLVGLYAGTALAVLGKGPVGAVLPGLVAVVMIVLLRDVGILRQLRLGSGALAVGAVAGSWYVMALILGGWQFFRKQVLAENVFTFLDSEDLDRSLGAGGHRHPASYLLGALLLGLLPWTVFLPGLAARLWRQRRTLGRDDARVYLLVWSAVVFGFYATAASKRSVYLLAMYPAVALLLGWWWSEQTHASPDDAHWLARGLMPLFWLLIAVVVVVSAAAALEGVGIPLAAAVGGRLPPATRGYLPWIAETIRSQPALLCGLLGVAVGGLYGCMRAARRPHWSAIFAGVFATVAALYLVAQTVVLPVIARHQSVRDFIAAVRQIVPANDDLVFYKTFDYGAVFYWERHIPTYEGAWPAGNARYVLMRQADWERAEPAARAGYERVAVPDTGNPDDGDRLVLVHQVRAQ